MTYTKSFSLRFPGASGNKALMSIYNTFERRANTKAEAVDLTL